MTFEEDATPMRIVGEAHLVAIAIAKLAAEHRFDEIPPIAGELYTKYDARGLYTLIGLQAALWARVVTDIAERQGQTLDEFLDNFEADEFLRWIGTELG